MHKPSEYELYLLHEFSRYGHYESEENDFPSWLINEHNVYRWIFKWSRTISQPLYLGNNISKELMEQI